MDLDPYLHHKQKSTKLDKKLLWEKLRDIGLDNEFMNILTKAHVTKGKIGKWDCYQLSGWSPFALPR
jgi:hypothetical protein